MTDSKAHPAPEPKIVPTLVEDVQGQYAEVRRRGIRQTVRRTFAELEEFYLSTARKDRLASMGRVRRRVFLSAWLIRSLFFRLTPARRLLLVLSFLLLLSRFQFGSKGDTVRFTFDFSGVGVALILLILLLELKDKLLAREELEAGRAVQRALTPVRSPKIQGWDVFLYTRSANEVGGDLVDHVKLGDERAGLALGDVAGKGLSAALLMARLQATFRALLPDTSSLGDLGCRINRILHRDGLPSRFATLVYLEVGPGSGCVRLLNAGHMPPLVLRGDEIVEMARGGVALGLVSDASYSEQRVDLDAGDTLVVYSDGVTEAMNRGGELFGAARLRKAVEGPALPSAADLGGSLLRAVDGFVGDAPPQDDLSVIVLRRAP